MGAGSAAFHSIKLRDFNAQSNAYAIMLIQIGFFFFVLLVASLALYVLVLGVNRLYVLQGS